MTLQVDVLQTADGGPTEFTKQWAAKAWANLNGTGTIAVRDSENISNVVDNGTGDYTFSTTTAMSSANYSFSGMAGSAVTTKPRALGPVNTAPTSSALRLLAEWNSTDYDVEFATLMLMGDLA